jgi:hypothetical protein
MQVGIITLDGQQIGTITQTMGEVPDTFTPDLSGYEPMGRADAPPHAIGEGSHRGHLRHHGGGHHSGGYTPRGEHYQADPGHRPVHQGSAETDQAIVEAARAHHLDPNTMRAIASIESSNNPGSNRNRSTQYKGLYQIGRDEWRRFGAGGDIYNARDNAFAAARMFDANRAQFHRRYGRNPTDAELYMMHQQGLGFYTRGAMTNIAGNPYPGMHGQQTHESFEAGWGREVARRKAALAAQHETKRTAEATSLPDGEVAGP